MRSRSLKNAVLVAVALTLASLGAYNLFLKATWSLLDDGVYWREARQGVVAGRVASQGPGARAGILVGDTLLGLDGEEVLSPEQVEASLPRRRAAHPTTSPPLPPAPKR